MELSIDYFSLVSLFLTFGLNSLAGSNACCIIIDGLMANGLIEMVILFKTSLVL